MRKQAYPNPDFARQSWLNLNGEWQFSFDEPSFDGKIEVPYPWGSPLSGISESKNGKGFYRRTVEWNPSEERIFIVFGAVDYTAEIRLNGAVLGTHRGGYTKFEFEVTELWNRDGENVIEVMAEDTGASNQTYGKQGYGDARGIWQTVWLEARPKAYISAFCVKTSLDGTVTYDIDTVSADGMTVSADFGEYHGSAEVICGHAHITLHIDDPKLWTPEEPNLYDGTLTLGGDIVTTYFGIREIGTGVFGEHGHRYITLNGKPYYINGVLDQSFNPKGFFTLPSDEDCRDEILRLKRIGVNMVRIHIKAEEPLKLYYADRLGMLIMADIPCFWGEPIPDTRRQYEYEMEAQIRRDFNHPSIFYWVIFNETWGLFSHIKAEDGSIKRTYTDETAKWVVDCYHRAKELDPTRLVEDNSPCNSDHTVTDVNSWHFYSNGYLRVKDVVENFCKNAYVGSGANYKKGYTMEDVPCMNSECGNVWGIKNNAGESDISWQYKYMINEFRLHDKLCGHIFTEFHDVVNEFNGYYKLDNSDKDFGYDAYGMSLRDIHSQDYIGADFAPMTTVEAGDTVEVPLFGSSFTDVRHGKTLDIVWQLGVCDPIESSDEFIADSGEFSVVWQGYGQFPIGVIRAFIPNCAGTATLSFALMDGDQKIMQNAVLFDIGAVRSETLSIPTEAFVSSGFEIDIPAICGAKRSGIGSGKFTYTVNPAEIPGFAGAADLHIIFEASTRAKMTHDVPGAIDHSKVDLNYMLGYRCDPGENLNSFPQTDEEAYPGSAVVSIDGVKCGTALLPDCPADSRGSLSHHYQPHDDELNEAGTYGYLCDIRVPSSVLLKLQAENRPFEMTIATDDGHGLSLFGRRSGRYAIDVEIKAE